MRNIFANWGASSSHRCFKHAVAWQNMHSISAPPPLQKVTPLVTMALLRTIDGKNMTALRPTFPVVCQPKMGKEPHPCCSLLYLDFACALGQSPNRQRHFVETIRNNLQGWSSRCEVVLLHVHVFLVLACQAACRAQVET